MLLSALILAQLALPSAEFDHPAENMIVRHHSPTQVERRCRVHWPQHRGQIVGCALLVRNERICIVYLPHEASVGPAAYERIYRHERGHCNGWRHV